MADEKQDVVVRVTGVSMQSNTGAENDDNRLASADKKEFVEQEARDSREHD